MPINFPLPIKALAIDLDGTMLDTAEDLADAVLAMTAELGLPGIDPETVKGYVGNGVQRLVKRALTREMEAEPEAALFKRAMPVFERHYGEHLARKSRPYPGALEGLQAFGAMGLPIACVTNKSERFTTPLLEATGLTPFFDLVLSGDSLPEKKPSPLPVLYACRYFGVEPEEMLLIGDSRNDAGAARAAGCALFCVPYGYNHGYPVAELNPDAAVASLAEASKLIVKK